MPFPSPGDLPDPGIKPRSPALQADALTSEPLGKPFLRFLIIITYHDEVFPDFREMKIIMLKYFKISVLKNFLLIDNFVCVETRSAKHCYYGLSTETWKLLY